MTVVSLLLSVRISFIAILRLIFYSHSDFSLQRRILKQRLSCLLLFKENQLLRAQLILMDIKKGKGKRLKQKTRRYLEETSESSNNDIRKNKDSSRKKRNLVRTHYLYFLKFFFHIIDVFRSRKKQGKSKVQDQHIILTHILHCHLFQILSI